MKLYNYTKTRKYLTDGLISGSLYFSDPTNFNDTKDSNLATDKNYNWDEFNSFWELIRHLDKDNTLDIEKIKDEMWKNQSRFQEMLDWVINNHRNSEIAALCLTTKPDNELMWAHYAESSKGVCLGFDTSVDKDCFHTIIKVNYVERLPKVKLTIDYLRDGLKTFFTTKTLSWEYEDEFRAFQHKSGHYKYSREALKEIIFGERIEKQEREKIISITKVHFLQPIDYFDIHLNKDKELELVRVE